jgi:hypothetical protein
VEYQGVIFDQGHYTPEEWRRAEHLAAKFKVSPGVAAAIGKEFGSAQAASPPTGKPVLKSDEKKRARKLGAALAKKLAFHTGEDHALINGRLNQSVGIKKVTDSVPLDVLLRRNRIAIEWLKGQGVQVDD